MSKLKTTRQIVTAIKVWKAQIAVRKAVSWYTMGEFSALNTLLDWIHSTRPPTRKYKPRKKNNR